MTEQDLREERLMVAIARVHHQNYGVYGARKVWLTLNREGVEVARCTVERLMKVLQLEGAVAQPHLRDALSCARDQVLDKPDLAAT